MFSTPTNYEESVISAIRELIDRCKNLTLQEIVIIIEKLVSESKNQKIEKHNTVFGWRYTCVLNKWALSTLEMGGFCADFVSKSIGEFGLYGEDVLVVTPEFFWSDEYEALLITK